jgi:hypothetical protein
MAKEIALPAIIQRTDLTNDEVQAMAFPLIAMIMIGTSLLVGAIGSGITLRRFLKI